MQFKSVAAAALLAASVSAYEVLTPSLNSTISKGESINIKWTSVDTDAEVFSVYLTNFATAHWPPTVLSLAQNVPRDDSSIDLRIPCDVSSDYGWQINFINGTNTYVIYAQSPVFELTGDCVEPAPATSTPAAYPTYHPTGYTNGTTKTVHQTATATLCKTVETVVYATPLIWFVEPSKEAVCEYVPAKATATVTVTVTQGGHGGEGCTGYGCPTKGSEGPGGPAYPSHPAGGEYPSGGEHPSGGEGCTGYGCPTKGGEGCTGYGCPTKGGEGPGYPHATGTGGYTAPTKGPEFTGAASSIKISGAAAMIVGAAAFLL